MRNVVITGVGIKSCIGNTYDEFYTVFKMGNLELLQINHMLIWALEVRFLDQ